jgi:hypothetical protein
LKRFTLSIEEQNKYNPFNDNGSHNISESKVIVEEDFSEHFDELFSSGAKNKGD